MPVATNKDNLPANRRTCLNCGRLGHFARACKAPEKAHKLVGIEVEGYWRESEWDEVRRAAIQCGMDGTTDGSLSNYDGLEAYEWRTQPGTLGEAINQLLAVYPHATADCAGMHVHVSFDASDMVFLGTRAFFTYFSSQWREWGVSMGIASGSQFWERLNGNNSYCQPPDMARMRRHRMEANDRYNQLNFSSWSGHKTLECRLLPMFRDARLGVLAVEKLIDIYESWLVDGVMDEWLAETNRRGNRSLSVDGRPSTVAIRREMALDGPMVASGSAEVSVYELGEVPAGMRRIVAPSAMRVLSEMGVL